MADEKQSIDVSRWMSLLPESLWGVPLTELAIPGTHDSFTAGLDPSSEISPDEPPAVQMLGPLAKGVVYNWSKTQNLNFKEQLMAGIRYFDLRVASRGSSAGIYFVHGLYCARVEDELVEIIKFLDSNRKEVLILDFNHFHRMNDDQHRRFLNMLVERCDEKLCLFVGMETLTLNMLWENRLQIIIVYHHKITDEFLQVWPGSTCIASHWANTMHLPQLLTCMNTAANSTHGERFKVCQCILTPDLSCVLRNLNGSLLTDLALKVMPDVMKWLQQQKRGKCGINIVTADYIELDDFTQTVIKLNFV